MDNERFEFRDFCKLLWSILLDPTMSIIIGVQINSVPLHTETFFARILGFAVDVDGWPGSMVDGRRFSSFRTVRNPTFSLSVMNLRKLIEGKSTESIYTSNNSKSYVQEYFEEQRGLLYAFTKSDKWKMNSVIIRDVSMTTIIFIIEKILRLTMAHCHNCSLRHD